MYSFLNTIATSDVSQRLSGTNATLPFNFVTFWGVKSFSPSGYAVNNTRPISLGFNTGELPISIGTGASFALQTNNSHINGLNNLWFKGGAGDGIYTIAF